MRGCDRYIVRRGMKIVVYKYCLLGVIGARNKKPNYLSLHHYVSVDFKMM